MPVAYKFDLKDVLDACRYYFEKTGRRITFEYSLVGGVNDSSEDARELTELVKDLNCHINLIPVNPIKERLSLIHIYGSGFFFQGSFCVVQVSNHSYAARLSGYEGNSSNNFRKNGSLSKLTLCNVGAGFVYTCLLYTS